MNAHDRKPLDEQAMARMLADPLEGIKPLPLWICGLVVGVIGLSIWAVALIGIFFVARFIFAG